MRSLSRPAKIVAVLTIAFLLQGCVVIYFPYFRNHSDETVTLLFNKPDVPYYYAKGKNALPYVADIVAVNKKTFRRLNDSLPLLRPDEEHMSVTVPPRSTVLVPVWGGSKEVTVLHRLDSSTYIPVDTLGKMKRVGLGFTFYYDYGLHKSKN